MVRDSIRRSELMSMGYTVITVTNPQVATAMGVRNLADLLAGQMGRRFRMTEPEFSNAHAKLRKELLQGNAHFVDTDG